MTKRFKGGVMTATSLAPNLASASGFWNIDDAAVGLSTATWPGQGYTINYLVVGGGGGGGCGGGGGAGGVVTGTINVSSSVSYTMIVGSAGVSGYVAGTISSANNNGGQSSITNTYISSVIGLGGGGGGSLYAGAGGGSYNKKICKQLIYRACSKHSKF